MSETSAPPWLFAGHVVYLLVLWWKRGLRPITVALAFVCGLLVVPYWRSYDLVVLTLPILAVVLPGLKQQWLPLGLAFLSLLILLFTHLAILNPLVLALGFWWVYRTEVAATWRLPAHRSSRA